MRFVVGCPVYRREWILPTWFNHVERECASAHVEPIYVFAVDSRDPSIEVVYGEANSRDREIALEITAEDKGFDRSDSDRQWNLPTELERMVGVRNTLLARVRELEPDVFLSLDSDILLGEGSLSRLLGTLRRSDLGWGAVGGKTFMSPGLGHPSYFTFTKKGTPVRSNSDGVHVVDVIMAIKLMGPAAYGVDYTYDRWGEDVGWSRNCAKRDIKLGWDGRTTNKHVMQHDQLDKIDKRCGF